MGKPDLDDRTRILMTIIDRLCSTLVLGKRDPRSGIWAHFDGDLCAQFVSRFLDPLPLKEGDIVLCKTGRVSPWKIARFVSDHGGRNGGHFLLREIGSNRLCKMGNEDLALLVGIGPSQLYEGHQRQLYKWAHDAFGKRANPKADYLVRCGGVEFDGDTMRIWVRPHVFVQTKRATPESPELHAQPWRVELKWSKKTRRKDVVQALLDAGFPREWEYTATPPDKGMAGCTRITREGLVSALEHQGVKLRDPTPPGGIDG